MGELILWLDNCCSQNKRSVSNVSEVFDKITSKFFVDRHAYLSSTQTSFLLEMKKRVSLPHLKLEWILFKLQEKQR
jgi:hypothetical protein